MGYVVSIVLAVYFIFSLDKICYVFYSKLNYVNYAGHKISGGVLLPNDHQFFANNSKKVSYFEPGIAIKYPFYKTLGGQFNYTLTVMTKDRGLNYANHKLYFTLTLDMDLTKLN